VLYSLPKTNANIKVSPKTIDAVLPIHTIPEAAFLSMSSYLL